MQVALLFIEHLLARNRFGPSDHDHPPPLDISEASYLVMDQALVVLK
jgi:hypothetical protein